MSIFLSYRRATQRAFAIQLRETLRGEIRALGMLSWEDVFLDQGSIDPGQRFEERLDDEIMSCDLFVALVDPAYLGERFDREEDFVRHELRTAFRARRRIVPLVLGACEWPLSRRLPDWGADFYKLQAITDTSDPEEIARRLASEYRSIRPVDTDRLHKELVSLSIVQLIGATGDVVPVLVTVGRDGTLGWTRLSDGRDYRPRLSVDLEGRHVSALAVVGHGSDVRVVLGLTDSSLAVCDLSNGELIDAPRLEMMWQYNADFGPLVANGAYCTSVVYAPHRGETRLVYGNTAGQINLFPGPTSGLPIWTLAPVRCRDRDAVVVSRREFLPRTGIGNFLEIRDMDSGAVISGEIQAFAQCLATSRTGTDVRIISGNRDGQLQLWDTQLRLLVSTEVAGTGINALAEVGGIVVVGNNDGTIQALSVGDLRPLGRPRREHTKKVVAIAAANIRNRRIVVSGAADGSVRSYMVESLLQSDPSGSGEIEAGAA